METSCSKQRDSGDSVCNVSLNNEPGLVEKPHRINSETSLQVDSDRKSVLSASSGPTYSRNSLPTPTIGTIQKPLTTTNSDTLQQSFANQSLPTPTSSSSSPQLSPRHLSLTTPENISDPELTGRSSPKSLSPSRLPRAKSPKLSSLAAPSSFPFIPLTPNNDSFIAPQSPSRSKSPKLIASASPARLSRSRSPKLVTSSLSPKISPQASSSPQLSTTTNANINAINNTKNTSNDHNFIAPHSPSRSKSPKLLPNASPSRLAAGSKLVNCVRTPKVPSTPDNNLTTANKGHTSPNLATPLRSQRSVDSLLSCITPVNQKILNSSATKNFSHSSVHGSPLTPGTPGSASISKAPVGCSLQRRKSLDVPVDRRLSIDRRPSQEELHIERKLSIDFVNTLHSDANHEENFALLHNHHLHQNHRGSSPSLSNPNSVQNILDCQDDKEKLLPQKLSLSPKHSTLQAQSEVEAHTSQSQQQKQQQQQQQQQQIFSPRHSPRSLSPLASPIVRQPSDPSLLSEQILNNPQSSPSVMYQISSPLLSSAGLASPSYLSVCVSCDEDEDDGPSHNKYNRFQKKKKSGGNIGNIVNTSNNIASENKNNNSNNSTSNPSKGSSETMDKQKTSATNPSAVQPMKTPTSRSQNDQKNVFFDSFLSDPLMSAPATSQDLERDPLSNNQNSSGNSSNKISNDSNTNDIKAEVKRSSSTLDDEKTFALPSPLPAGYFKRKLSPSSSTEETNKRFFENPQQD
eukprot:Awhi_evm2s731